MMETVPRADRIRNVPTKTGELPARPVPRRRDEVLVNALREATRAELAEHGYAGVTFEGVARRARTSKRVLYRRYRSRAHMVADALPALSWQPKPTKAKGSLRKELLAIFSAVVDRFERIGIDTFCALLSELDVALLDEYSAELSERFTQTLRSALSQAAERGEIGPSPIPDRVVTAGLALLRHEMLFSRRAVSRQTLLELIDTVYFPLIAAVSDQET
jgi:AcrR family transcriptional regulator